MSVQDIIREIPRLSTREQLLVLQAVSSALSAGSVETADQVQAARESVVDRLYGAFNPGGQALTDEDVDRIRFAAVMEKHQ